MASASFVKLRRLAPRSIRILARRSPDSPAIAAFGPTLEPKAKSYIAAFDESAKYQRIHDKELGEGRSAVAALKEKMAAWVPSLARDLPSYDATDALDRSSVPDDVLAAAEKMIQVVDEAQRDGAALPYAPALLEDIGAAFTAAVKEWGEADTATKKRQDLLAVVRETGALFDSELQLFRRTLLAVGGRSDADYQKLRADRASVPDPEDDVAVEPAAPAATGKKPVLG